MVAGYGDLQVNFKLLYSHRYAQLEKCSYRLRSVKTAPGNLRVRVIEILLTSS